MCVKTISILSFMYQPLHNNFHMCPQNQVKERDNGALLKNDTFQQFPF